LVEKITDPTLTEIASALDIDTPVMTGLLDSLETKLLLSRHPSPLDRRAKLLQLTAQGRATLTKIEGVVNKDLAAMLSQVSNSDMAAHRRVLEAIIDSET
jgi:DNA-binding MarR family transcriptional regulator